MNRLPKNAPLLLIASSLLLACVTPAPSSPTPTSTAQSRPTEPQPETESAARPEAAKNEQQSAPPPSPEGQAQPQNATDQRQSRSGPATGQPEESGNAMTREEQDAQWDRRFDLALGDFDERLARERVEIEEQQQAAGAAGGNGENVGEGESEGGGGLAGQTPEEVDGEVSAASVGGTGGRGAPNTVARKYPAPADVPSGQDDDVVARQLREAAETEKDPELRAKLWEEYRKYKKKS